MYLEGFEQWSKLTGFSQPMNEFSKTTSELFKRIAEQNLEIVNENYNRFTEQLKRFSTIRKPEDLLSIERDCLNENVTAYFNNVQKIMQLSLENVETFTRSCGATASKVSENAVDKAQKYGQKFNEKQKETR